MNKKLVLSLLVIVFSAATVVAGIQTSKSINHENTQPATSGIIETEGITAVSSDSSYVSEAKASELSASVAATEKADSVPNVSKASDEKITAKEAEAIALNKAGFAASEVYDKETELDYEKGVQVYEVSFEKDRVDYEYVINAVTGEVLRSKSEPEDDGKGKASTGTNEVKDSPATEAEPTSPAPAESKASDEKITAKEAEAIALNKAGFAASEVYDKETELDYEKGVQVYEVSFEKDRVDYEYVINAVTGEVLRSKSEPEDDGKGKASTGTNEVKDSPATEAEPTSPAPAESKASDEKITAKEAEAIALNKAGFAASEVYDKETELDYEKGVQVYEVSFEKGRTEYEYVIDAVSGEILRAKSDNN